VEAYSFAADKKLEFVYDYLGRRVEKKVTQISIATATGEERFLYDGWNLIVTFTLSDLKTFELSKTYTWGLDLSQTLQGAGGVGGLLGVEEISGAHQGVYAFAFDVNGNVSEVYDDTGAVAAHYEYSPFGEIIRSSGSYADSNPFRFSTKYLDAETELYYYGYRHYDPATGRWLNRDPLEELGGLNLYGFNTNDALNRLDAHGQFGVFGAALGGIVGGITGAVSGFTSGLANSGGNLGAAITSGAAGAIGGGLAGAAVGAINPGLSGAVGGTIGGAVAGAIGGAVGNATGQVVANLDAGQSLSQSISNITPTQVGVAAGVGAFGGALGGAMSVGTLGGSIIPGLGTSAEGFLAGAAFETAITPGLSLIELSINMMIENGSSNCSA
jgi:RHS repeat-associated protein